MAATDHPLKRVVALAGLDLAAWVLGQAVQAVESGQGALLAEPEILDTDLVLRVTLATGEEVILHVEFQGPGSKRPMPLRMLEYQARLADTYRGKRLQSVVFYVGGAGASDTGEHAVYTGHGTIAVEWHYLVIHLWQLRAEDLLALDRPALLVLIGQTQIGQPVATLTAAVARLAQHAEGVERERLLTELLILCTDKEIAAMAEQIIERDYGLPETPMMRKWRDQGREEGREEGQLAVLVRQLQRRCGPLPAVLQVQVQHLGPAQRLDLAEAVFDFTSVADLEAWLGQVG
ncbi:MAG: DUF4351 domain-containing protein [Chloroflexia bacterium]|nr:DUF4351 domain-containing protein [Chloroflexia bacterium]